MLAFCHENVLKIYIYEFMVHPRIKAGTFYLLGGCVSQWSQTLDCYKITNTINDKMI